MRPWCILYSYSQIRHWFYPAETLPLILSPTWFVATIDKSSLDTPECRSLEPVGCSTSHIGIPNDSSTGGYFMTLRPDQFNLLLLGYCEVKIGPSDRKKERKKGNQLGCGYRPQSN